VFVRLDHVAGVIVNADHSRMCAAEKLCVFNSVIRLGVPQPAEWQRVTD
jgi:hypothetical protein